MSGAKPLVCPACGVGYGKDDRFCETCGMPLVFAGPIGSVEPVTEAQERARKIKKQYTEGPLSLVAGARHQAEAELIQGLLIEEGVPSMLRRTRGFDVPDMLAAGPRDVLVPASGLEVARELLLLNDLRPAPADGGASGTDGPGRVLLWLGGMVTGVAVIAWVGTELVT